MLNSISPAALMLLIMLARFTRGFAVPFNSVWNAVICGIHDDPLHVAIANTVTFRFDSLCELERNGFLKGTKTTFSLTHKGKKAFVALMSNRNKRLSVGETQHEILTKLVEEYEGNAPSKNSLFSPSPSYWDKSYQSPIQRLEQRGMVTLDHSGGFPHCSVPVRITEKGFAAYVFGRFDSV